MNSWSEGRLLMMAHPFDSMHPSPEEWQRTMHLCGTALHLDPRCARAYARRGWLLVFGQHAEAGLQDCYRALQFLDYRDADIEGSVHETIGHANFQLSRFREARLAYERALQLGGHHLYDVIDRAHQFEVAFILLDVQKPVFLLNDNDSDATPTGVEDIDRPSSMKKKRRLDDSGGGETNKKVRFAVDDLSSSSS